MANPFMFKNLNLIVMKCPCKHTNLYRLILMVSGLSDDNLRSLIRQMCVENNPEGYKKRVREVAFNQIGMRPLECGAHL